MDLFTQTSSPVAEPLASRMRPRTLDEYVGQDHILGEGRLLRRAIKADQLSSLIFYGPPGTGKTTLARVIANSTSSRFVSMNAVLSGVKELREAIEEAREAQDLYSRRTILFVDEVHRWNKSQQDALLPWVEQGTIVLIGATTENPYFEVNKALVSRSRVFQLKGLTEEDLRNIVNQTISDPVRGYGSWQIEFDQDALNHLVNVAGGDARSLLNALQLAIETTPESFPPEPGTVIHITLGAAEESIQQRAVLYDKEGDYHFDTISAFIKSLRGSDPDAALYWMARMIRAGEDPRYIFRRMLISACEDVGMADPHALGVVEAAASAYDRVGLPEGHYHLAHATLYLATCPKSNSALAFFDALDSVAKEDVEIPNHLRDSSRDKHSFGHGKGYRYPHAFREHWVAQQYLPEALKGRIFYQPSAQGYEGTIQHQVIRQREEQLDRMLEEEPETLTYSPGGKERDRWIRRVQGNASTRKKLLTHLLAGLKVARNDRILLAPLRWNQLFWELFRLVPEGGLSALVERQEYRQLVEFSMESLPEAERPLLIDHDFSKKDWFTDPQIKPLSWEHIVFDGCFDHVIAVLPELVEKIVDDAIITICQPLPGVGSRLSLLLANQLDADLLSKVEAAEVSFYQCQVSLPKKSHLDAVDHVELAVWEEFFTDESLIVSEGWLDSWLKDKQGSWLDYMKRALNEDELSTVKSCLKPESLPNSITWQRAWLICRLKKSASFYPKTLN